MMASLYTLLVFCLMAAVQCQSQHTCPHTWQSIVTFTSTINGDSLQYAYMYYDYDKQMDALQFMAMKPGSQPVKTYRLVHDYSKERMYTIPEKGPCTYSHNPMKMFPPDGAGTGNYTFLGSNYVGDSDTGLSYNSMRFTFGGMTITIAANGCVPIIEGVKAPGIDTVMFYSGYQTPIRDMSAFNIPPGCTQK